MRRIMLIDDDRLLIDVLCKELSGSEIEIVAVEQGLIPSKAPDLDRIVEDVVAKNPDYILVDLDLVGDHKTLTHGYRLLRRLNEHPRVKGKFIAVITSHASKTSKASPTADQDAAGESLRNGAQVVISKEEILRDNRPDPYLLLKYLPGLEDITPPLPMILIFEDQSSMIQSYKEIFAGKANCRFQGVAVLTPELIRFISTQCNLVIVDLSLTTMDEEKGHSGLRLIREMRSHKELSTIPIVVCSKYVNPLGNGVDSDAVEAIRAGANDCFPKTPLPAAEDFLKHLSSMRIP